jgi:hypothetical protein
MFLWIIDIHLQDWSITIQKTELLNMCSPNSNYQFHTNIKQQVELLYV